MTTTCFRSFLRSEFDARRARNPRYSLRAFARRLDVDHSTLSQWMRGRRPIGGGTIESLGRRLGLTQKTIRVFVEERDGHGADLRILRLVRRPDFVADSRWLARELNVTLDDANRALHRLLRLELLRMAGAATWIDTSEAQS